MPCGSSVLDGWSNRSLLANTTRSNEGILYRVTAQRHPLTAFEVKGTTLCEGKVRVV
jgi:hypothetical protein